MLRRVSVRSTWLPLGLAGIALVVLNLGLYMRLGAQQATPHFEFPYTEDFAAVKDMPYDEFGGDWEIRDQALVQLSTSGYDLTAFVPLHIAPEQPYAFTTTMRFLGGTMGGGMLFNAQQTTSRQKSHMARFNVDGERLWVIYGYFGDDSDFIGQGSVPLDIAPNDDAPHQFQVHAGTEVYAISLDGTLIASDIPLEFHGGAVGFIASTSQYAFDDVSVLPADPVPPSMAAQPAPTAPTEDQPAPITDNQNVVFVDLFDTAGAGESLWRPISGEWRYENGAYVQALDTGFDLSAIYQQPVTYPVTMRTTFQHRAGVGGGVLFNLPAADSKNGGHMVRYVEGGQVVAWGYFDANGVFNGQGSAPVATPGQDLHTLEVRIAAATYEVYLDGVELARDIALISPVSPSYIGLTSSESAVAFDEVVFLSDAAQVLTTETTNTIDIGVATGTWIVDGGAITQADTESTDYVAGTGLAGERFAVTVDIALPPDNPDAGAGIVFHMSGRDDPRSGHMVRFGSGGQELFWGRYDADGIFTGEGGIPLDLPAGETITLMLVVREGSFDIHVNGETLVEAIPTVRSEGWIGLISFSGPVTFLNVNLQLSG